MNKSIRSSIQTSEPKPIFIWNRAANQTSKTKRSMPKNSKVSIVIFTCVDFCISTGTKNWAVMLLLLGCRIESVQFAGFTSIRMEMSYPSQTNAFSRYPFCFGVTGRSGQELSASPWGQGQETCNRQEAKHWQEVEARWRQEDKASQRQQTSSLRSTRQNYAESNKTWATTRKERHMGASIIRLKSR